MKKSTRKFIAKGHLKGAIQRRKQHQKASRRNEKAAERVAAGEE